MGLIAIDGNSLMFRAFYALPGMSNKEGTPTGALHGFLSMLLKLIERKPDHMLVGFDLPTKTFRHEQYSEYKAGRRETPDELKQQFPILKSILAQMGIAVIECEHFEADDILGTFSRRANKEGIDALLVTGDRDALQLITDNTHVLLTKKGISETIEYDEQVLFAEYGLDPEHMVDLKGLMGDNSDNLPGVKGVGEKTALKLLVKYGNIENVLQNAENEKGALREKLINGRDDALMSYRLGTIDTSAPIEEKMEDTVFNTSKLAGAIPMLTKLELRSIVKRIRELCGEEATANEWTVVERYETKEIKTMAELSSAVESMKGEQLLAFEIGDSDISLSPGNGEIEYRLKLGGTLLDIGFSPKEVIDTVRPLLESNTIGKVLFDAKRVMTVLSRYRVSMSNIVFDLMPADYLLNPLHPTDNLKTLAEENGLSGNGAGAVHILRRMLESKLKQNDMLDLYRDVELPLVTVLFEMEQSGFTVDSDFLVSLGNEMSSRIKQIELECYELAGERFNILSPKQLGTILFEKLELPAKKKTKTGYSTDSDALDFIKDMHPIVPLVSEYRFLTKLKSTFIDAMLNKIDKDGRIHTTLNQNVTATGRISSQDPNLQNIPVRTELGRKIRKAFIASPGNKLVGADYSQIELRVLAHMSGDEALISAFRNGEDVHLRTASEVFSVPIDEVTEEMRSAAKAVNFGIVYGISAYGLSTQLGITQKMAAQYIERYLSRCTGVKQFMHNSVEEGKARGYAVTILGRRRPLPELLSSNHNTRSFGERVAMNMPIQGSAADIIKVAMVRVHKRLSEEGLRAKLILQIHDELIIDAPIDEVERVSRILNECMCGVAQLQAPLVAQTRSGDSWFDTK